MPNNKYHFGNIVNSLIRLINFQYQAYPVNVDSPKIVGQGDVFKLDKPLERGPRPTLYLGHDLRSTG